MAAPAKTTPTKKAPAKTTTAPSSLSPAVIRLLQGVVNSVQLQVGSPDFDKSAALLSQAKRELDDLAAAVS